MWRYTKGRKVRIEAKKRKVKPSLKITNFYYYWTRIHTQDNELNEIDFSQANYDFDLSAGIGIIGLGMGKLLFVVPKDPWAIVLVLTGAVLLVGAYYQLQAYEAVMSVLWERHQLSLPEQLLTAEVKSPPPPRSADASSAPS